MRAVYHGLQLNFIMRFQNLSRFAVFAGIAGIAKGDKVFFVSSTLPVNASAPVLDGFVSFSIELSSFPDFAGRICVLLGSIEISLIKKQEICPLLTFSPIIF